MIKRVYESVKWRLFKNRYAKLATNLASLALDRYKVRYYYQYFPPRPSNINLNANDICNSGCTMCNIWKNDKSFEVSPEQLQQILSDKLFQEVAHVGITGGEPTLRDDLPQLYEAVIKGIPNIVGLSIITNAIRTKDVIERIEQVYETVVLKHGRRFSMMVSLDGYGEMHDQIRGKKRNFESAITVINHFKQKNAFDVAIGCTISKNNVYYVDDLLDYMRLEGIYGRFRVAEFIKRLYNEDRGEVIRNYTREEAYHLMCFFKKLELTFETNETYKRTYRSIINVLDGGERLIGCPFQAKGIVVDSRGDLQYCAPKSPVVGNGLKESAQKVFENHLGERRKILAENCDDCIHDYHAPITYKEFAGEQAEQYFKGLIAIENLPRNLEYARLLKPLLTKPKGAKPLVFITGWYGTETVGDKAIIHSIIKDFRVKYPNCTIVVSSMYPFVTKQTMYELNEDCIVINAYSIDFFRYSIFADHVVMGGGPLMHINELALPLISLAIAKQNGHTGWVYGCGLGPLGYDKHLNAVKRILTDATHIMLRDTKSATWAKQLTGRNDITVTGDPAVKLIQTMKYGEVQAGERYIACFIRSLPHEYWYGKPIDEFEAFKKEYEQSLAVYLKRQAALHNAKLHFYSMHTFVVGDDDRDFYRSFIRTYFDPNEVYFERKPSNIEQVVAAMKGSVHNICMRFHSVVFANTLGSSFTAIDYTDGGKIAAYLKDNKCEDNLITINGIINHAKA